MALAEHGIHIDPVLRVFHREVREGTADLRPFVQGGYQLVGVLEQVFHRATLLVLHIQFEAVDATEAGNHRLCVHLNLGVGDIRRALVDGLHHGLHVIVLSLALIPLLQFQREVTVRGRLFEADAVARH